MLSSFLNTNVISSNCVRESRRFERLVIVVSHSNVLLLKEKISQILFIVFTTSKLNSNEIKSDVIPDSFSHRLSSILIIISQ